MDWIETKGDEWGPPDADAWQRQGEEPGRFAEAMRRNTEVLTRLNETMKALLGEMELARQTSEILFGFQWSAALWESEEEEPLLREMIARANFAKMDETAIRLS